MKVQEKEPLSANIAHNEYIDPLFQIITSVFQRP